MTPLAVTAIGMATSLGLDSACACAGARAGLVRLREITTLNYALDPDIAKEGLDGVPLLVGHMVPVIGAGCAGIAKLLALSRPALTELIRDIRLDSSQWHRTALGINISDGYFQKNFGPVPESSFDADPPTFAALWTRMAVRLTQRLCDEFALPIEAKRQFVVLGGRVGVADVLLRAAHLMERGEIDRCIIGGVESCVEAQSILAYAAAGVLKCAANPTGFIPGEGAAFLVVERGGAAAGPPGAFLIGDIAQASDASYLQAEAFPQGAGLSTCMIEVLADADAQSDCLVIADLNGAELRALDWGHALVHLRARFPGSRFDTWLPALSFGETGAAAGALALCMAYRAIERGYLTEGPVVVALSSEDGRRAALRLDRPH